MSNWNSSPHPISDIRDWSDCGRLEIQADFQRRAVWNESAKIMLMDTILKNIPMPKIFLSVVIKDNQTHRIVVDGQQRIRAILAFMRDEFCLSDPYAGEHSGKCFSQLPSSEKDSFLLYKIDFNEIRGASDAEIREIYSRVNKYTIALNKQELRRADYPGEFLDLAEKLSSNEYLDDVRLFTPANRRRLSDVEYTSELIVTLIEGPQEKKVTLDEFYKQYSKFPQGERKTLETKFNRIISDLALIFDDIPLSKTRFRQKSDFYSLFCAVNSLLDAGGSLEGKDLSPLREDLNVLDYHIEPSSGSVDFREYAVRCVSDANSLSSRVWRKDFLINFLGGTYLNTPPEGKYAERIVRIAEYIHDPSYDMCPRAHFVCAACEKEEDAVDNMAIAWPQGESIFQVSNSFWIHIDCLDKTQKFGSLTYIDPDQLNLGLESEE